MLYVTYHEYKLKFLEAQEQYNKIVNEKQELFSKTQPGGVDYDKERVSGGAVKQNAFDTYVIKMEKKKIDERLEIARSILEDRERLLKLKELELRSSKNWFDIIYKYHFIEGLSSRKIERLIPFSKSEINRKIKLINIKLGQNVPKGIVK